MLGRRWARHELERGAQAMLGYTAEEILGQSAARFLVNEEQGEALQREMREAQSTGRATARAGSVRKNADHLYVEGSLTAVRDDFGRLLGYAKLLRDVTEISTASRSSASICCESERAARAEAERASRMKDEFLATLEPRAAHAAERDPRLVAGAAEALAAPSAELAEGLEASSSATRARRRRSSRTCST